MWSKLHFLDTCQSAETKAGMDRRRLIVGEINTLVKQWIKTEGVHQVSQRYFNIEVEHCKSYFAGYGLARSSKITLFGVKPAILNLKLQKNYVTT